MKLFHLNPNLCLILLSLLCGLYHLTAHSHSVQNKPRQVPLPVLTHYRGYLLTPIPLTSLEQSFQKNFPGQIRNYHYHDDAGVQQLIVRTIHQASRKLHPSAHCLRAAGFLLSEAKIVKDAYEEPWAEYYATQGGKTYTVRERIITTQSACSQSWTDVSAWYWNAVSQPRSGPWQAETLICLTPFTHP